MLDRDGTWICYSRLRKPLLAATYGIVITRKVRERLAIECALASAPTGGILVGSVCRKIEGVREVYTIVVDEAVAPTADTCYANTHVCRGTLGLSELLSERWIASPRTYYVGEWRYHPKLTTASALDDDALEHIARSREYSCNRPVLLSASNNTLRAYLYASDSPKLTFTGWKDLIECHPRTLGEYIL